MLSSFELERVLGCFPVLKGLSTQQLEVLGQQGDLVAVPGETTVFGVGSRCDAFLFLTSGSLRVFMSSPQGREILLYRVEPGESCVLTTSCLLADTPYPARGVADTRVTAVAISSNFFHKLIAESDAFRSYVFTTYADRILILMSLFQEVAFKRLDERLANHLLMLGPQAHVTHQQLALELGTAREVISRILKHFESKDILKLSRQRIQIVDVAALEKIANS